MFYFIFLIHTILFHNVKYIRSYWPFLIKINVYTWLGYQCSVAYYSLKSVHNICDPGPQNQS